MKKRTPSPVTARNATVMQQVKTSFAPGKRLATLVGFALGGFVPLASFVVAHYELRADVPLYMQLSALLVLGGLLYSAKTVYEWGKRAFQNAAKALGFVVLLEGVMVTSTTTWLGWVALGYLVVINGLATGCNLSREK